MAGKHSCPWCGKPAPKETTTLYNADARNYRGNLQIVHRSYEQPPSSKAGQLWRISVWDGESYRFGSSDPFCTSTCAYWFAVRALEAGYRRK